MARFKSHMLLVKSMSLLLLIAGGVHLISPEVFLPAMPPYLPFHLPLIYFTGILELMAAVGLVIKKYRRVTGFSLVAYFIAILPAHFHIAIHSVSLFGITDPVVLWGRLVFQSVLIYGAYRIANYE
ncbi:MAG: DoxX family protein [Deltaproteobacteria bacterium]|nr:DoxX family protein [Deltaproteobacteria bacterium]